MRHQTFAAKGKRTREFRAVDVLLATLILAGLVLALFTPVIGGIGWDGPYEVELGTLLMQTTSDPASLQALRQAWAPQDLSKGPLLFWVSQILAATTPLETWSGEVLDPHNYVLMGMSSALIGFTGIAILAGCLAYTLRSRTVGLLALSLTMTLPLWVGLSALDYRDTQVASGLAAATGAGLLAIRAHDGRLRTGLIALFSTIGGFLAVGSRSGSILLLGAIVVWILVITAIRHHRALRGQSAPISALIFGAVVGSGLAVASHPLGRADPISWLRDAVVLASDHPNVMLVRVLGQNITSNESPWWYVPAWLVAQLPVATSVAMTLMVVGFIVLKPRTPWRSPTTGAILVLLGPALVIPMLVVATGPNLFDGIRHMLFLVPALFALISAVAWSLVDRRIRGTRTDRRLTRSVVSWSLIVVVGLSLFATARWFPYSYAFVNPVAGAIKEPRIWEYDYWGTSSREAIELLRETGEVTEVFVRPNESSSRPFGGRSYEEYLKDSRGRWGAVTFFRFDAELPEGCTGTITIHRDGIPLAQAGPCR